MSSTPAASARAQLMNPLQFLKGVGPDKAKLFARLGLRTVADLLFFFPRGYHDLSNRRSIAQLEEGVDQSVRGVVEEVDHRSTAAGGSLTGILVREGSDYLRAVWFNQPHMRERHRRGEHVLLFGKPRFRGGRWEMPHPKVETLAEDEELPSQTLQPIYPLTEGLGQHSVRAAVENALSQYAGLLEEVFSPPLLARYDLLPLCEALPQLHFPPDSAALERARRRFVFQELFVLQLALALRRHELRNESRAVPLPRTAKIDARIRRLLPFELTADQNQAIAEIAADMDSQQPMNRLLQGDVGTGKTLVAVYAMLLCVAHGQQAALMAPTEVLAVQHFQTLQKMLAGSRVRWGLITGGQSAGERETMLAGAAAGELDVVVGTQALLNSSQQFARLGLVVIDEQHKFGVRQRAKLRAAGLAPHYLVMTATPIPRTVGMTLFGDLDVSTLRSSPPGRQPVQTYLVEPADRERWWDFVCKKLREGRQAYVVAPLVEESAELDAQSAEGLFEELTNGALEAFRVGLVHGRMTPAEKGAAVDAFRRREHQALVSTSLVEVGIDVPNATLMTVDSPSRFGLAQLHQLRGRIRRGATPGFCAVFAEAEISDEARERLAAFVETSDGFELAELDFRLRGPGDLLGTRQHGLPPFRIANLLRDTAELEEARAAARQLVEGDPGLARAEHALLRRMATARYGDALDLGDVG